MRDIGLDERCKGQTDDVTSSSTNIYNYECFQSTHETSLKLLVIHHTHASRRTDVDIHKI